MMHMTMQNLREPSENKPGFIKAMWCGDRACEDKIKEDVNRQHPDVCRLKIRNISRYLCMLWKTGKKWYTGEKHTNMKLTIPSKAEKILHILEENGYEAYVVGGCVRDSILERMPERLGYHHICIFRSR